MKHIFQATNNLSFSIALSVQEYLSLDPKKVFFLTTYEYDKSIDPFKRTSAQHIYKLPVSTLPQSNNDFKRLLFYFPLKRFINEIDLIPKDEDFIFYTCNMARTFCQVLGSSKRCVEVRIIEEGGLTYNPQLIADEEYVLAFYVGGLFRKLFRRLGRYIGHFLRYILKLFPTYSPTQIQVYSIHKKAFPHKAYANTVIPFYEDKTMDIPVPEGGSIYFNSHFHEKSMLSDEREYKKILEKVLTNIREKTLYIKFHHHNTKEQRQILLDTLEKLSKETIILPDKVRAEQIFLRRNQLKVYAILSVTLFYAKIFNAGEVYAFHDMFKHLIIQSKNREEVDEHWKEVYSKMGVRFLQQES